MEKLIEITKMENFLVIVLILLMVLIALTLINIILIIHANIKYMKFMKKLGKGSNLDEMLKDYLRDVKEIKKDNSEIKAYYTQLDHNIDCCIQKVGLVRYNAFKDVGSDLSFAIALLDRNDNGVIFNGLYGSESSNIYAKPVKAGISSYKLSDEEKEALEIAEQDKTFIAKRKN